MKYGIKIASLAMTPVILGGGFALASSTSSPARAVTHRRTLPADMHWRTVWYQIDDCGKHNAGQPKIIIWRGNGNVQSAMFCPNGTILPS